MATGKAGGSLKGIFDPKLKAAAALVMEAPAETAPAPPVPPHEPVERIDTSSNGARNRKAGGRNVRISGYIPPELEEALRDEVIRRTTATRKIVSMNDVLCDALTFWQQQGRGGH